MDREPFERVIAKLDAKADGSTNDRIVVEISSDAFARGV